MFTAALFTIAKIWKPLKYSSTDKSIKEWQYIFTIEYYLAIDSEVLPFGTAWMDLDWLSEISQSKKDKYHIVFLIGGI